ncbi:HK97 gp10 family phage protein [Mycobacterium sp. NPDC050853]|uniref:HK97 gp10 family phage protein n=1 Tax=Mycobacterium sp. NPDC050853 TaxID=3155160 RepID=UPI00340F4CA5
MASVRAHFELNEHELNDQTRTFGRRRMTSLQRRIANQARADAPVRTGNLGRQVTEGQIGFTGPRTISGNVRDDADYALYVHEGTRPHLIRPRNAKALRFQIGGRTVYAKLVRHPGTKARPFLRNAGMRVASRER